MSEVTPVDVRQRIEKQMKKFFDFYYKAFSKSLDIIQTTIRVVNQKWRKHGKDRQTNPLQTCWLQMQRCGLKQAIHIWKPSKH